MMNKTMLYLWMILFNVTCLAAPDSVKPFGLPKTSFLFITIQGQVLIKNGDEQTLTPFIGKVDHIKIPGNARGFHNTDLRECYVVGYGKLLADERISFNEGTLYCRPQGGDYRQVSYKKAATHDEGLSTDIAARVYPVTSLEKLSMDVAANLAFLQRLAAVGINVDTWLERTKGLVLEEIFEQSNEHRLMQLPVNLVAVIGLLEPLTFPDNQETP